MRNFEVNKCRKPISEIHVDSFAVESLPCQSHAAKTCGGNSISVCSYCCYSLASLSKPGYRLHCRGSIPDRNKRFSLLFSVQTGSGTDPASYPLGSGGSFPDGRAAGAWTLPLTSIYCRSQECWIYTSTPQHILIASCLINLAQRRLCFTVLTSLPVSQSMQWRMIGWLVSN